MVRVKLWLPFSGEYMIYAGLLVFAAKKLSQIAILLSVDWVAKYIFFFRKHMTSGLYES